MAKLSNKVLNMLDIIDFVNRIIQQVRRDFSELVISVRDAGLIKLVKL